MGYERTQKSPLWLIVSAPLLIGVAVTAAATEGEVAVVVIVLAASLLFIGLIAHFSWMTVAVDASRVRVWFGSGWPRRVVEFDSVTAVEIVRNHWYWGWGIRGIPRGWLWHVWGLDAVEIQLVTGKRLRIGTDDPGGLYGALVGFVGR